MTIDNSHSIGVVHWFSGPTFPLHTAVVQSKGQTFKAQINLLLQTEDQQPPQAER